MRAEAHLQSQRLTVRVPGRADEVVAAARAAGLHLRPVDADTVAIAFGETAGEGVLTAVLAAFGVTEVSAAGEAGLPEDLERTTDYLTHPVFNTHHNETSMLRYVTRLANRDYALAARRKNSVSLGFDPGQPPSM